MASQTQQTNKRLHRNEMFFKTMKMFCINCLKIFVEFKTFFYNSLRLYKREQHLYKRSQLRVFKNVSCKQHLYKHCTYTCFVLETFTNLTRNWVNNISKNLAGLTGPGLPDSSSGPTIVLAACYYVHWHIPNSS